MTEKLKKLKNRQGEPWTKEEDERLKYLAREQRNMPTGLIAYYMGRSESSIRNRAYKLGVSLMPINRSPYNRREKK